MRKHIGIFTAVLFGMLLSSSPVYAAAVEYENLRQLVTDGNPDLLKTADTYYSNLEFYEQTIKELQDEKDSLLLMEDHSEDPEEKSRYRQNAQTLSSAISRMQKNWQSQTQIGGSELRSLDNAIDVCEYTAQSRMIAYRQMENSVSVREKQAEAAKKRYEAENLKLQAGASTQEKADLAREEWQQQQNMLETCRTQAADLRFQLLSFLGLSDEEEVTIGAIPEPDLSLIDGLNFEEDLQKAVNNNSSVKSIRHSNATTASGRENKEDRETEAVGKETAAFTDLYQQLLAARIEYQAALDAYTDAELVYHTLQLKKQAGMLAPSEYLTGEADYLEALSQKENAGMTLHQLYQSYLLEVKGSGSKTAR